MSSVFFKSVRLWIWSCFAAMFFFAVTPAQVSATDAAQQEVRDTVVASMEAVWTGKAFAPDLAQKQQKMRSMLDKGLLTKAELESIVEQTIPILMNRHITSRYYLQEISGRIDGLFGSHLTWEEIKKRVWKEMASIVKDGDQMVFKVGTLAPKGTPWLNVPEKMLIPRMEELSDGKITLKLYGGGIMGEDYDILRKIDIGQLDVCGATTLGMLAASPETAVFMLPGLFNNYEEIDYIYKKFRKRIDAGFEERGYILAALIDTGHFHIYSKNRIDSLADLRKQKVISCWGTVESTIYNELGINPIPVVVPEVMSALSTGLADTTLAPAAWMLGMQAYQYAGYYITPPLLFSPAVVILGVRAVERIQRHFEASDTFTRNVQELLVFEVGLFEGAWRDQIRTYDERALNAFKTKTGMKAVTLSAADQAAIAQAGLRVRKKLAGTIFSEDLMNDVLGALEEFRANQAKP
ncbi:TRAP transporter substrate-binding protein DctP [Desulfosudis oleivorans]|uniref:TRAP dicarboxylate transporter-DctP subunit n=1 Tax=Desulfosudis oleivorans (strain DSM 6200 / JCM 39069 / Hxd3) TaxID=96561 RepID=A9A052_DESOH|nr:TRAP transporter substrate-binding protein DctP [Desulfosudis oleivorans]ABW68971.1 TRAP dicarboxylate transporter- DctP subunit [Desulfosudis oleivorans Hxd3]